MPHTATTTCAIRIKQVKLLSGEANLERGANRDFYTNNRDIRALICYLTFIEMTNVVLLLLYKRKLTNNLLALFKIIKLFHDY